MKNKLFSVSVLIGLAWSQVSLAKKKLHIPEFRDESACRAMLSNFYEKAEKKSRNPAEHIRKKKYLKDIDCYTIMFIESRAEEKVPPLLDDLKKFISDTSGDKGCSGFGTDFWTKESERLKSVISSLASELHWSVKKKDYKKPKKILSWSF